MKSKWLAMRIWIPFLAAACLVLPAISSAEDMNMSALQKTQWHDKAYSKLPEVYGPGKIIYLPLPKAGEDFRQEIENLTFSYCYTRDYQENRFDCSDMSIALWYMLQREGYDAKLVINTSQRHMWVGLERDGRWTMIETTAAPSMALGVTADSPEYFSNFWMFNTSAEAALFTDDKLPLLLSQNRTLPIEEVNKRKINKLLLFNPYQFKK